MLTTGLEGGVFSFFVTRGTALVEAVEYKDSFNLFIGVLKELEYRILGLRFDFKVGVTQEDTLLIELVTLKSGEFSDLKVSSTKAIDDLRIELPAVGGVYGV